MKEERSLCWLRRDLRLSDSAPLAAATQCGRRAAVAFIWDDEILSRIKDRKNRRVTFIHRSLEEINQKLHQMGTHLIVRRGKPADEIPKLAQELQATTVFWGEDYDPSAIERDEKVSQALNSIQIKAHPLKDIVIFHKDEVKSQTGSAFKVYSPYARSWKARFQAERDASAHVADFKAFLPSSSLPPISADHTLDSLGFIPVDLWLEPGEEAARQRLNKFLEHVQDYGEARDFPAQNKTSTLSVDFRFGTLSIREAVRASVEHPSPGSNKWLAELIWREFYQHILYEFPYVCQKPFQKEFEHIKYPGTEDDWIKWRDGQTGYPLVDAAMRCLNETGYMHNRLRMVVASFLSKDLLLDYRQGEQWFAKQLLDYELASNNGGWQWASSVGCDPQPYFRVFNPILQSKKFDPDGVFIRQWVPELSELSNEDIHFPSELSAMELLAARVELGKNYPNPCVDHGVQRVKAVALLESAKKSAPPR